MTVIISGDTGIDTVGSSGVYIIRDNGAVTPITPANWRLIVRAWA